MIVLFCGFSVKYIKEIDFVCEEFLGNINYCGVIGFSMVFGILWDI